MLAQLLTDAMHHELIPAVKASARYIGHDGCTYTVTTIPKKLFDSHEIKMVKQTGEHDYVLKIKFKPNDFKNDHIPKAQILSVAKLVYNDKTGRIEEEFFYHHEARTDTYKIAESWARAFIKTIEKVDKVTEKGCGNQQKRAKEDPNACYAVDAIRHEHNVRVKEERAKTLAERLARRKQVTPNLPGF